MRILIADDHALIRAGLRALLLGTPGVQEVFEAGNGDEALRIVSQYRPQVALMDIAMPGMSGLQALSRIRETYFHTRVIILSMHTGEEYVARAMHGGASGYLVKSAGMAELRQALMMVMRGCTYVSQGVLPSTSGKHPTNHLDPLQQLTLRQREVLSLIAHGLTTREIAATLGIHEKTAESHRAELMHRLGIHSLAGLVHYAIRRGLMSPGRGAAPQGP